MKVWCAGALVLLPSLARAGDCARWLEPLSAKPSFAESVAYVARLLPGGPRADFERWAATALNLPVLSTDGPSKLRHAPRLFDLRVRRAAAISWSSAPVETDADRERLIEATIDVVTEAAFTPVRRHTIYLGPRAVFTRDNLELWRSKLIVQMFTLSPRPAPRLARLRARITAVLRPLLPTQFAAVRGLRLNDEHVRAFEAGGADGLYRYLRAHEGLELSVRYWLTHLANLQVVLAFGYALALAPPTWDAAHALWNLHGLTVDDAHVGTTRILRDALRAPPDRVLDGARALFDLLGPAERRALQDLFGS